MRVLQTKPLTAIIAGTYDACSPAFRPNAVTVFGACPYPSQICFQKGTGAPPARTSMPVKIDDLLVTATAHFASDLHLKVGSFPVMRIGGELFPVADAPRLSPENTLDMAFSMMSNRQKQKLKEVSEVDIAYSVSGLGRF